MPCFPGGPCLQTVFPHFDWGTVALTPTLPLPAVPHYYLPDTCALYACIPCPFSYFPASRMGVPHCLPHALPGLLCLCYAYTPSPICPILPDTVSPSFYPSPSAGMGDSPSPFLCHSSAFLPATDHWLPSPCPSVCHPTTFPLTLEVLPAGPCPQLVSLYRPAWLPLVPSPRYIPHTLVWVPSCRCLQRNEMPSPNSHLPPLPPSFPSPLCPCPLPPCALHAWLIGEFPSFCYLLLQCVCIILFYLLTPPREAWRRREGQGYLPTCLPAMPCNPSPPHTPLPSPYLPCPFPAPFLYLLI